MINDNNKVTAYNNSKIEDLGIIKDHSIALIWPRNAANLVFLGGTFLSRNNTSKRV